MDGVTKALLDTNDLAVSVAGAADAISGIAVLGDRTGSFGHRPAPRMGLCIAGLPSCAAPRELVLWRQAVSVDGEILLPMVSASAIWRGTTPPQSSRR